MIAAPSGVFKIAGGDGEKFGDLGNKRRAIFLVFMDQISTIARWSQLWRFVIPRYLQGFILKVLGVTNCDNGNAIPCQFVPVRPHLPIFKSGTNGYKSTQSVL